jgi:DNA-binding transcriptional LysR family regulator
MSRITIVSLETLCWIARLGSFTAAAEYLNTTQPAISKRVKDLEDAVGVSLFHRQGRRMELTIQGRDLVQRAQPLLTKLKDVVVFRDNLSAATGVIRIGVGEIVAVTWFSQLMVRLKELMPGIHYELDVGLTVDMRQRLEVGLLDLAILAGPIDSPQITTTPLGGVDILWLISEKLAKASSPTLSSIKELLEAHTIWCVARPSHMHPMVVETLRRHGLNQKTINTSSSVQSIVEIVTSGAGIAMLPDLLVIKRLLSKELQLLSAQLKPERLEFVMAHHRDQDQQIIKKIVDEAMLASAFFPR